MSPFYTIAIFSKKYKILFFFKTIIIFNKELIKKKAEN